MMVYPMIDLIYMACDAANVSCGHLYLHRPPEQMLESTVVHTGYHTSLIEAIVVYTSFLERIESDLRKYNHRTWGCISFYDDDVIESLSQLETIGKNKHQHQHQQHGLNTTVNTNKTQNKIEEENIDYPSWFNIVPPLLGFDNSTEWARYMKSKHKLFQPDTNKSKQKKKKKRKKPWLGNVTHTQFQNDYDKSKLLDVYRAFTQQHHRTKQVCENNVVPIVHPHVEST
jgi:hypothetical protein